MAVLLFERSGYMKNMGHLNEMDEESIRYLEQYIRVTPEIKHAIGTYASRFGIKPCICAWYRDMEDFYSEWCNEPCNYTRKEAWELMHNGIGEFMTLPHRQGIVRFVI